MLAPIATHRPDGVQLTALSTLATGVELHVVPFELAQATPLESTATQVLALAHATALSEPVTVVTWLQPLPDCGELET